MTTADNGDIALEPCEPFARCPVLDNGAYHGVCLGHEAWRGATCTKQEQPCPVHGASANGGDPHT